MIPAAAVEAAALALVERDFGVRNWGITTDEVKSMYMDEARTALEAAAPHLMADARWWRKTWRLISGLSTSDEAAKAAASERGENTSNKGTKHADK